MADELELLKDLGRETADPDEASVKRARTLLQRRIDAAEGHRKRHWRPLHVRWAIAAAVAVLLGSGFGFGLGTWNTQEGSARTSLVGLGFLPAKGWTVVQSTAVGQRDAASAVATNVPLRPNNDLQAAVRATRASLPAHGIVIVATFTARGDPAEVDFARRALPLSIKRARVVASSVGSLRRLRASVGAYNVDARIFFGTASPSTETVDAAQRQLNRLVVASERVTILARPTVLGRGQRLTLFGSADTEKAEEIVTIETKNCGQSSFRGVAAVRTREGGGWSTDFVNPGITATFRAVWNNATSAPVTVQARASVQLRRRDGSSSKFTVGVGGQLQFWRRYVVIERFERRLGVWKPVKKVVLTETGSTPGYSYVFTYEDVRVTVPKGTLIRAVFPLSQARPCYLSGVSQQIRT